MVSIADIDIAVNSQRESMLSFLSNVSGSVPLQSIFVVVGIAMVITLAMEYRKGREERKGVFGPIAILILCVSVIFGFRISLIAWIVLFFLATALVSKLKQGEWKGCLMIILVLYLVGFLVSVNPIMLLVVAGVVTAVGVMAKKANFQRTFGRGDAARELKNQGVPVTKERRVLRGLARIARRGYRWTRDPIARSAAKIKQRYAERALKNEAEQMREAEIVAAGEDMSKTLYEQQTEVSKLEEKDSALIQQVLEYCDQLKAYVSGIPKGEVEAKIKKEVTRQAYNILKQLHTLVKNKLEEDTLMQRANKVFERCLGIIQHSAHEATQLKEHKADFREMKKTAMKNIESMRKEIKHETRELEKGIAQAKHSSAEGASRRADLMKQRQNGLSGVSAKLAGVEKLIVKIDNLLMQINADEDKKIDRVQHMSEQAKKHGQRLRKYEQPFDKEAKQLEAEYKKFRKLFEQDESSISEVQLVTVTDETIIMFKHLKKLTDISFNYHKDELAPLVQELVKVAQDVSHLSTVSQSLTKLYFRLSQANESLTQMAMIVDQNPESRKQLEQVWKTEGIEEQLTRKAYRRGRAVVGHIQSGYKYLQAAYSHLQRHMKILAGYDILVKKADIKVVKTLDEAFDRLGHNELAQAAKLKKAAEEAERRERQGLRAEKFARAAA